MARFGEFDRRVGEIAAALVVGDEFRRLSDEAVKLADRIARALRFHLGPDLVGLAALVVEIFEDEVVLRAEVAIERHLVGVRRFGDRLDPDAADAVAMKEVERAGDDALARRCSALVLGLAAPAASKFLRHGS